MKIKTTMILACCLLMAAGCATTGDPRQGGFFGGIGGIVSGSYDKRIEEKKQNLGGLQSEQLQLDSETSQLEAQKQERLAVLDKERQRLDGLEKDLDGLDKKLAEAGRKKGAAEKNIQTLKQKAAALDKKLKTQKTSLDDLEGVGEGGPDDMKIRQLQDQNQALKAEYDTLLKLTMELAQ